MNRYSHYYHAILNKENALYVVGTLKYFDHICFDRTLDRETLLYEFFVPQDTESDFLKIMDFFAQKGFVTYLQKKPNRIEQGEGF